MMVAGIVPARGAEPPPPRFGEPQPFSFDALRARAKALAAKPYVAPAPAPKVVDKRRLRRRAGNQIPRRSRAVAGGPGCLPRAPLSRRPLQSARRAHQRAVERTRRASSSIRPTASTTRTPTLASTLPRRPRLLRLSCHGRPRQGNGLARLPGRQLLPHLGRGQPVRRLGARHRHQHRLAASPRSSRASSSSGSTSRRSTAPSITIYALLDGPSITGAYRFEAAKGRGADHRHQRRSLRAHRHRARRRRAAHQHVLVRRERPAHTPPTGARRSMTATALPCGPASASTSGGRSSIRRWCAPTRSPTRRRRASASCSATATSPSIRTTAPSTIAAPEHLGRAGGRLGRRRRAARRDPDRRRDPRQHRRLLAAEEAGARRRRTRLRLQALLAERRAQSAGQHRARGVDARRRRRRARASRIPTMPTSASSSSTSPAARWRRWSSAST